MKGVSFFIAVTMICLAGQAGAQHRVIVTSVAEPLEKGPDALLMSAVAQVLGLKASFRNSPFKRRLIMMENGDIDMICGLLHRPGREAFIHYIHLPYKTRSDTIFFVLQKNSGRIRTYEDLKGLKIGVSRGSKYFERFDLDTTLSKESALSQNNFKKLLLGRIDTVIQDESNGIFLIHDLKAQDRIVMSPFRFSNEKKVYFGISRKSWMMDDLERIERALETFITSGRAREIISGYYIRLGLPVPAM